MIKKILFVLFCLSTCYLAFGDTGDVTPIATMSPQNYPNSFQYITRSTYVFVDTTSFSQNLSSSDVTVQHALQTIDHISSSGAGTISTITAGSGISVTNSTGPNVTVSISTSFAGTKFSMPYDPLRAKYLSPGTTNFPGIDNSTGTSTQSAYWSYSATETLTFSQILRPYQGGNLYADFYYTGSTLTTGGIGWGVFLSCNGSEFSKNVDSQLQNYTVDVTTAATAIPSTAGNIAMLEAGPLTLNSCAQGDEITMLITRTHSGSDAKGDVRMFPGILYEK